MEGSSKVVGIIQSRDNKKEWVTAAVVGKVEKEPETTVGDIPRLADKLNWEPPLQTSSSSMLLVENSRRCQLAVKDTKIDDDNDEEE